MKAQHNLIFGDACIDEFVGYAVFGFVPLYPNFAINDIKMNQATVDAGFIVPTQGDQNVAIVGFIEDGLTGEFPMRVGNLGIGNTE